MPTETFDQAPASSAPSGVLYAGAAFLIWGIGPVYWKVLAHVPAVEIIMHRIVWSFLFLLPLIVVRRRWGEFMRAFGNRRILLTLVSTAVLVALNWLIYIWAVNHQHILQASLGYYINPLVNVLLGMLFLRERLRRAQALAVLLAVVGVLYLTFHYGQFPWIALALAFSFGIYGLIRKTAPVGALVGLTVETLILAPPAAAYLLYLGFSGRGAFLERGAQTDLFLVCSALMTGLPLLLFALGVRRLYYSTVGLMQYIAPCGMFLLAVFVYGEPFSPAQLGTFVLIWVALAIYSTDSFMSYRRREKRLPG
jgi:chloramphenicol-sensitive protein RarD